MYLQSVLLFLTAGQLFCMEQKTFRNYEKAKNKVEQIYYENHTRQTVEFVKEKRDQYLSLNHMKASVWDIIKILDNFIDESDPDLDGAQTIHAFQTAEALRKDHQPRWMVLTGFLHDLGKILSHFGEPQWAVVGDTFPVGCAFDSTNIYPDFFKENPDYLNPAYNSKYGIYSSKCGFDQLLMSFGHDEYLYHVMKPYLPKEALYIIRFHSFYPAHRFSGYTHLMSDEDERMLPHLKKFCSYDLYSKSNESLIVSNIIEYYKELVSEFLPEEINW
jgi:inositol oxygenase